jgi:decaprenylphospho-beta-D-ribofuranose 2-oxidase
MKFHKKDDFYLSYSCDGISLGIDIQLAGRKQEIVKKFYNELFDYTSDFDGKIYLAKDEKLDCTYFKKMFPKYKKFLSTKYDVDPNCLFSSNMYKRLFS